MDTTPTLTPAELIAKASAEGWKRGQVKDACYLHKVPAPEREAIYAALGMAATGATPASTPAPRAPSAALPAAEPAPAPIAPASVAPTAPPILLADGAIIWCDAAENTVRRTVNRFGRLAKFDNGGHRIGLKCGQLEERHYNSVCPDQFAGECFAVLKAVELAARHGLKTCTVRNDRIAGFSASTKRGYAGAKYLWVAEKIARESGLDVTFDLCTGAENLADRLSRTES